MLSTEQIDHFLSLNLGEQVSRIRDASETSIGFAVDPGRLSRSVLARHAAEHVLRIRRFRQLDAAATKLIEQHHPEIATPWSRYARSEAVHDRYFLRDLEAMGIAREHVEQLQPFQATEALISYIRHAIGEFGPLPVVVYSFWAEKNSDEGSAPIIARGRSLFGDDAVRGASAHRALDENLNHAEAVTEVLAVLIDSPDKLLAAVEILGGITKFIGLYFDELGEFENARLQ
ncbi:hypothetical protein LHFGNBLO_006584 (plasmid) [Mesorhizobium sp. AR10]|uniref:hypothetical protein n=1 Tax=Mesorhizobium sp. AR10 TaxID=2865839 RepID=UPI00215E9A5E|nr:hypothetical protein [Mesorhizobium sp. AR10]UVK35720.1 hypothetical protein LHFGNBLO_006584 [Mesorhizobium sp. AR10]